MLSWFCACLKVRMWRLETSPSHPFHLSFPRNPFPQRQAPPLSPFPHGVRRDLPLWRQYTHKHKHFPINVWKYIVWWCCMVYLPRCESTKSEGGALTSESGFDRSHDTGEFLIQWNEDMPLQWLAVHSLLSVSLWTRGAQPAKDHLFLFIVICRRWPGCSRLIDRKAESSNSIAATSHRPPASLTDHHTSELFCQQSVLKKIWLVWNYHQCCAKCFNHRVARWCSGWHCYLTAGRFLCGRFFLCCLWVLQLPPTVERQSKFGSRF